MEPFTIEGFKPVEWSRIAIRARSWALSLALLLTGALLLVSGVACTIMFLVDSNCSAYGCGAGSLIEMFIIAVICILLFLFMLNRSGFAGGSEP